MSRRRTQTGVSGRLQCTPDFRDQFVRQRWSLARQIDLLSAVETDAFGAVIHGFHRILAASDIGHHRDCYTVASHGEFTDSLAGLVEVFR